MKSVTGELTVNADDEVEAGLFIADFVGRSRALGWNVDDITVTLRWGEEETDGET